MSAKFVVTRVGNVRLRVCHGNYRAECLGDDERQIRVVLSALGLDGTNARFVKDLRDAIDLFRSREKRSIEKFGKAKMFRIWRVDRNTLQVDFDGGYAELNDTAHSDQALKRCLAELGASDLLLTDLKKELREFLKDEHPEPLPNVIFFRDDGVLKVMIDDAIIHTVDRENDTFLHRLAKRIPGLDPQRFVSTFHEHQSREKRIQRALKKNGA